MRRSRCRTPNKCQSRSSLMGMASILCVGSLSPLWTVTLTREHFSSTYSQKHLRRQLLQRRQRQLHQLQVELHCGCPSWWVCLPCLWALVGDLVLDGVMLNRQ